MTRKAFPPGPTGEIRRPISSGVELTFEETGEYSMSSMRSLKPVRGVSEAHVGRIEQFYFHCLLVLLGFLRIFGEDNDRIVDGNTAFSEMFTLILGEPEARGEARILDVDAHVVPSVA